MCFECKKCLWVVSVIWTLSKSLELWGMSDMSIRNVEVRQGHYGHLQIKYTVVNSK